jgi:hypothetical protein
VTADTGVGRIAVPPLFAIRRRQLSPAANVRDDRHEKLDVVQLPPHPRHLVAGERIAGDLDDLVALDDAVRVAAIGLISQPAHGFLSLFLGWSAIIAEPPTAATEE